ncbi:MAG: MFS transporter [Candidatus Omnitrophica bacterium]|nr:MFS transporter [Candidatus Omnitrophota bacterium]
MKKITFVLFCLEGAVLSFNVAAVSALVPSIAKEFNLAQVFVGKIIWIYMLPYGLAALFYGPLAKILNAKKIELVCIFFFSLANLLAALAWNIYSLFVARFFMGVFGASVIPLALILIAKNLSATQRGRSVGIFFSTTFIASLLGLFLSGVINWRWIFLLPAIAGLILFGLMYFILPNFKAEAVSFKLNYLSIFKNKIILNIFSYIFLISLIYHGLQQWLAVYFSTYFGFTQFIISMLITLASLSGVFGEALGGFLADILGRKKTVNLGMIWMILSIFLLLFKLPFIFLAIIMFLWGLGWTFNHAGLSTILTDLPNEFLYESASLNSGVRFISGGLGVVCGALLIKQGFNVWLLVFGACLVGLLFFSKNLILKNN